MLSRHAAAPERRFTHHAAQRYMSFQAPPGSPDKRLRRRLRLAAALQRRQRPALLQAGRQPLEQLA